MRFWIWLLARLAVAAVLIGWALSYLWPDSAPKELQRAAAALKQVSSLRYVMVDSSPQQHNELSGELVCSSATSHDVRHYVVAGPQRTTDTTVELLDVGGLEYTRTPDGTWSKPGYAGPENPQSVCQRIAQGGQVWFLPEYETFLKRGIVEKGSKRTVGGVRCRDWRITTRPGPGWIEHTTVCVGLDDHLPHEMSKGSGVWTYSDFNQPIEIEPPPAETQQTGAN